MDETERKGKTEREDETERESKTGPDGCVSASLSEEKVETEDVGETEPES